MQYDYLNFNRQPLRFTKADGVSLVSLSDVLTIANLKRPDNLTTINSSITTEYGYNPIELVSVADAIDIIRNSGKSNMGQLIKVLSQKC